MSMNWIRPAFVLFLLGSSITPVAAGEVTVTLQDKQELKAVFGQIQSRTLSFARTRIGGTVTELSVTEGTSVKAGDELAVVVDDKLALQLAAIDSRIKGLESELNNAKVELDRSRKLLAAGVIAKNRADATQTQYDVLFNQHKAAQSDRAVLIQQSAEGRVFAPATGRVLSVPVTHGSVVMPGEPVARIASDGYFIRLALPERHAANLKEGSSVLVGERGLDPSSASQQKTSGKIVKVYPEIENGRVLADVETSTLGNFFVGERTLVWVPVGQRATLSVPASAVFKRSGIDYVDLAGHTAVAVITGEAFNVGDVSHVEILSGLTVGDKVITP